MKKTFEHPSRPGLFLLVRSLLLFAVLALQSVEASAQSPIPGQAPQVELVPVRQREVTDHYLNKVFTDQGWKIEAFDGARESVFTFGKKAVIGIAPNQRYFTVAKPVAGTTGETAAYDVELRDLTNSIVARGQLATLESEEADDAFVPANDGSGLIQRAIRISGGLAFAVFQRQQDRLLLRFRVDKPESTNGRLSYEPAQQMIVAAFEHPMANPAEAQTFVQCFSPDGTLQWETALDGQFMKSDLFISAFDGTVSFVSRDLRDETHKNLFLFGKNGTMLGQLPVYRGGLYQRSYYHIADGRQYFLSPSDGEFYYVIDPARGEIINRQTQGKEGSYVTGLAMFQQYTITSYFTGGYQPGPGNTQEFVLRERGSGLEDAQGSVHYVPLDLTGEPFLLATGSGLFLREKLGLGVNETNKFYKINLK